MSVLRNLASRNEFKLWVFQAFQNPPLHKVESTESLARGSHNSIPHRTAFANMHLNDYLKNVMGAAL